MIWPRGTFKFIFYVGPPITSLKELWTKNEKWSLVFHVEARRPGRPGAPRVSIHQTSPIRNRGSLVNEGQFLSALHREVWWLTQPLQLGGGSLWCSNSPRPLLSGPKDWRQGAGGWEGGLAGGSIPIMLHIFRDKVHKSSDMQKIPLFYINMVWSQNSLPKKVRKLWQIKFAIKQHKRPKKNKIGPQKTPQMPKSNNKFQNVPEMPPKRAKLRHYSLFRQNVKFGFSLHQHCWHVGTFYISAHKQGRAGTSKAKQGQAGTSRENQQTSRGNLCKQDTNVSTDFIGPVGIDLINTVENGPVQLKND